MFRYLRTEAFPERESRGDAGRSLLDSWRGLVLERWDGDRRNGRELFRELQRQGLRGRYPTLARYLQRLRAAEGTVVPHVPEAPRPRPVLDAALRKALTPRTAAWSVLRRAEKRGSEDQTLLADLRRHSPDLEEAVTLAEEFIGLVRDRAPDRLDPALRRARKSAAQQLCGFAERLSAGRDAVHAAVSLD